MCRGLMIKNPGQKVEIKNYKKTAVTPRFCYYSPKIVTNSSIANEISFSLSQKKKFIHPKFFYDAKGSDLFEKICDLPEYYLTRTEIEILGSIKSELSRHLVGDYVLVELGSGSSIKTRKSIGDSNYKTKGCRILSN